MSICPYDEFISLRLRRMIPAIMLPPLSVAKFILISIVSLGLSSRMVISLFTVKRLVAAEEAISEVMVFPAWWKVSLQGNLTASLSSLMLRVSSQDSISFIVNKYLNNMDRNYLNLLLNLYILLSFANEYRLGA